MAGILRDEIRWADLNPTRGSEQAELRPVLVLSHDIFNERSGTVIAVALISQIRTLATDRIGKRFGRASPVELAQVLVGLNEILGA